MIVIKERDDAISKINEQLSKIWELKLQVNKKKFFISSLDDFEINKVFISSFLNALWNFPEAIYYILNGSETEIVKSNLAPFIINNFYCNYLSGNYMENNLLYIISLMLKDEIDKLENVSQTEHFLDNTKCGFLLEELIKMPDIQIFFKNIIFKTIEKMERTCSFRTINFKISEILKEFKKIKDGEDKKANKKVENNLEDNYKEVIDSKILDPSINYSKEENEKYHNNNNKIFMKKYVAGINISDFQINAKNAKMNNKINLYKYFNKLQDDIKSSNNPELYSNTELMDHMLKTKLATYMLLFYQNDFLQIISFINQLIDDLMKNILLLPNSIKCICKIISILIKKKFGEIRKEEENAFISKFIIEKLLIPIIKSPSNNALIIDFVISENTLKNIKLMCVITEKLFSGKLFQNNSKEADYTPFNWLFMDKIENIFEFFEKATNANLPKFIEKYIKEELSSDYFYDFFNENKEEICANISIGFTIENLFYLIEGLKKSEDLFRKDYPKIKKLKKSFTKLSSERNMNNIKEVDNKAKLFYIKSKKTEKINITENEILNYYLYNDFEIEKKYEKIFSINNKIANFYINLKNIEKSKPLNEEEKNIIKIKNYLCSILGNFRILNKSDFNEESTSNTIKMLNEIKSYLSLQNYILNNNTIPSVWYINSILNYLSKIPSEYIEKNYEKLFKELTNNLNDSINTLDFENLILFKNKVKFVDKMYNYYEHSNQLIRDIKINEKIKEIVERVFIPVDIYFNYLKENEKNQFELKKSNIKEKLFEDNIIYEDQKKKCKSFKTIEAFTRFFPKLAKYQYHNDVNPIDIMKDLKINEKIANYFQIIKEKIIKRQEIGNEQYEELYKEKIINYIMDKLYDKIYPIEPDYNDIKIFKKTNELSWVEFQSLINKDYIFDIMLPEILNEFNQINISKTPLKKLNSIKKIMDYIDNLIKFNEGIDKEIGAEDVTPVLNYIFIKAQPPRIYTDIEFIKLFLGDSGEYENALMNFKSMCKVIIDCNADTFNLSKEEYEEKCIISINGNS